MHTHYLPRLVISIRLQIWKSVEYHRCILAATYWAFPTQMMLFTFLANVPEKT
jgi:hypothetical protein